VKSDKGVSKGTREKGEVRREKEYRARNFE
jgi:hypothetical protein